MSVLVFLENWDGKFKKLSFELVSYASKVAEMLGDQAIALSIGKVDSTELEKLATYGAEKIISIENDSIKAFDDQAYTGLIAEVARKPEPKYWFLQIIIQVKHWHQGFQSDLKLGWLQESVNCLQVQARL